MSKQVGRRLQTQRGGITKSLATACLLYFFQMGDKGNVIAALYFVAGSVTVPAPPWRSWHVRLPGYEKDESKTELFLNDFFAEDNEDTGGNERRTGERAPNPHARWSLQNGSLRMGGFDPSEANKPPFV